MAKTTAIQKKDVEEIIDLSRKNSIIPSFSLARVTKSNCKFCQLDFRDEAEVKYDEFKNYVALKRWLEGEKDTKISINAIRNHIFYHYKSAEREESLAEYSTDISKWVDSQTDKIGALKIRIAVLDKEMMSIAAEGQDLPLEQRRKNAETIKKLADTLLLYQSKIEEYTKRIEPITVVVNQLKVIITDEIQTVGDARVKKALVNVLEKWQNTVGDIIIEEEGK